MKRSLSAAFWQGRRVFITGHTGFKGSWLALWLHTLGAQVYGYALVQDDMQHARATALAPYMEQETGDICDTARIARAMQRFGPDVVIHLAAQALVRASYEEPLATFQSNVMGTACVLEAVRTTPAIRCALMITTDKCYEDQRWPWGYRETDRLGGYDPYSASKAAAELTCAAWRSSFLVEKGVAVMTARAGNVIGGGDLAKDRLIPDMVRAIAAGRPVHLRNPQAVRPWQHVLEPLAGYLHLIRLACEGQDVTGAWNFGPDDTQVQTVQWMAEQFARAWGAPVNWILEKEPQPHETDVLLLDCSKARRVLGWRPALDAEQALGWTAAWYRRALEGAPAADLCMEQIRTYTRFFEE